MNEDMKRFIIDNIEDLLEYGDIGFVKAIKGTTSEFRALKDLKKKYDIKRSPNPDAGGNPDFTLVHGGKEILIEHKRVSKNVYANGDLKLEFQKSRASKGDPSSRYYSAEWCDLVSVDISEHTGIPNDKRFIWSKDLDRHKDFPEKIKALHRQSTFWYDNLEDALCREAQLRLWEDK